MEIFQIFFSFFLQNNDFYICSDNQLFQSAKIIIKQLTHGNIISQVFHFFFTYRNQEVHIHQVRNVVHLFCFTHCVFTFLS